MGLSWVKWLWCFFLDFNTRGHKGYCDSQHPFDECCEDGGFWWVLANPLDVLFLGDYFFFSVCIGLLGMTLRLIFGRIVGWGEIVVLSCNYPANSSPPPNKVPFGGLVVLSLILLPCFALTFGALYFGFSPFHETSKCAYEEGMFIHGLLIILERSCANFFSLFWLHILPQLSLLFALSGKLKF